MCFKVVQVSFQFSMLIRYGYFFSAKDATDDFEDVGHSTTARAMMEEYLVGEIDATTIPTKVKYTPPKQPHYNQDKTPEFIIKILQFLVPLAILGLAVAVRIYTKSESA
jgi:cytochrome b5